ncbi:MAG: TlpA disulfide reductase family protein [Bacteroidetes bacterium]|nr:TlpA disulfide reductase family protein [Bacteroidota bacterium]
MKQLQIISILFITILMGQACSLSSQNKTVTIQGSMRADTSLSDIVIEDYSKKPQIIASCPLGDDGTFKLTLNVKGLDFVKLKLSENNYMALILLPGEQVTITSTSDRIYENPVISGSQNTSLLFSLSQAVKKYDLEIDTLYKSFKALQKSQEGKDSATLIMMDNELKKLDGERKTYIRQFAETNPQSPANLYYLNRLDIKENLSTFIKVNDALYALYPDNPFVVELNYSVTAQKNIQPGMLAQDINLPDPDGKIISLSSLRGHIVLIDFWASWCGPCRRENPNVVNIYRKYHDAGFEVYGVSLDSERSGWIKAIEKDSLTWTQVSDLKRFNSVAAKAYAVRAIPFSVLIDREGKIITTALRGSDLAAKLQEIFGY